MKKYIILSLILVFAFGRIFSQEKIDPETIRNAQRNVCAVNIMHAESGKTTALGCGVQFKSVGS